LKGDGKERNAHVRDRDLRRLLAVVLCLSYAGCLVCLARREGAGARSGKELSTLDLPCARRVTRWLAVNVRLQICYACCRLVAVEENVQTSVYLGMNRWEE
jgi:hypothetical protein